MPGIIDVADPGLQRKTRVVHAVPNVRLNAVHVIGRIFLPVHDAVSALNPIPHLDSRQTLPESSRSLECGRHQNSPFLVDVAPLLPDAHWSQSSTKVAGVLEARWYHHHTGLVYKPPVPLNTNPCQPIEEVTLIVIARLDSRFTRYVHEAPLGPTANLEKRASTIRLG